jgi:alanine-synthesizing transaminase
VFSSRCPQDLEPNRLSCAFDEARRSGPRILDLTQSNPTQVDLPYAMDLLADLSSPSALLYRPSPFGAGDARAAVAADYARRGLRVPADRIVLTASSSESYSQLFKLLADPGDDVLVPRPSYPLFDHLARLEGIRTRSYDLDYHGRWSVDLASLERALTPRSRAILAVSPNNPTGSFVRAEELDRMAAVAQSHGLAILVDEVFADYVLDSAAAARAGHAVDRGDVLTFSLGGLSKSVGLPQIKLGWIVVSGPADPVERALDRLELICDTYLSVSTPAQVAVASLLRRGAGVRSAILQRVAANHRQFVERVGQVPSCQALSVEGGWYGVIRVPAVKSEEEFALALALEDGVLAYPGYFFDFPREAFLVVSLLTPEAEFAEGVDRILRAATRDPDLDAPPGSQGR